ELTLFHHLQTDDLFLYCGHQGCEQYVDREYIQGGYHPSLLPEDRLSFNPHTLGIRTCALLIGCSSARITSFGPNYDVWCTPYDYLIGGSPFVMGNLWNVTDGEIDSVTRSLLWKWTQQNSSDWYTPLNISNSKSHSLAYTPDTKILPLWLTLTEALNEARNACRLRYSTGAATVCFGLPL
ncbi:peptidase family c50 protein, partial [Cardiosporidium cionae]